MKIKTIKTLLLKSILVILALITLPVMASERCIQGIIPTEEEFESSRINYTKLGDEIMALARSKVAYPQDQSIATKLEDKQKVLDNKIDYFEKNFTNMKLLTNVKHCIEFNLSKEKVGAYLRKWKYIALYNPTNKEYIYNFKLFQQIVLDKAFS